MTGSAADRRWREGWSIRPSLDCRLELARAIGPVGAVGVSVWQGREVVATVSMAHDFDCVRTTLHDCHESIACAYDAETGALVASLPDVNGERVIASGSLVVIGNESGPLAVWDFATGNSYQTTEHIESRRFALTQGGLILASHNGIVSVRDAATGTVEREIIAAHPVSCMATAEHEGQTLAFLAGREAHAWDVDGGHEIIAPFPIPLALDTLAAVQSGRFVAVTTHGDGLIRFWDLEAGLPWHDPIDTGTKYIADIALTGHVLVVSTELGVQVWDISTGRSRRPLPANTAWSSLAATHREGQSVLYTAGTGRSKESLLTRWHLDQPDPPGPAHHGDITAVAFSGPYVVTAGRDGALRRWHTNDGTPLPPLASGEPLEAVAGAKIGGMPFAVTGGAAGNYVPDEPLRCWDLTRDQAAPDKPRGRNGNARTTTLVTCSIDGRPVVLAGGHNGQVYLWDVASGRKLGVESSGCYYPTGIATGVLDGQPIAVISRWMGSPVVLWNLATLESTPLPLPDFETVWALYTSGGRLALITASHRGDEVRRWDPATSDHAVIDPGQHEVTAIALSHSGHEPVVAIGRIDGTVTLRDPRTGDIVGGPFLTPNPITALASSPDGHLAACFDGDIVMLRSDLELHVDQ